MKVSEGKVLTFSWHLITFDEPPLTCLVLIGLNILARSPGEGLEIMRPRRVRGQIMPFLLSQFPQELETRNLEGYM